jgi:hypothetical protein
LASVVDTNVHGVMFGMKHAAPIMIAQGSGQHHHHRRRQRPSRERACPDRDPGGLEVGAGRLGRIPVARSMRRERAAEPPQVENPLPRFVAQDDVGHPGGGYAFPRPKRIAGADPVRSSFSGA